MDNNDSNIKKIMYAVLLCFVICVLSVVAVTISCFFKPQSAYEVAVKNGFVGTEQEWLASLKGDAGDKALAIEQVTINNLNKKLADTNSSSKSTLYERFNTANITNTQLSKLTSRYLYSYSDNAFIALDGAGSVAYIPTGLTTYIAGQSAVDSVDTNLFTFTLANNLSSQFSNYLIGGTATTLNITTGLDVGAIEGITTINYTNTTSTAQNVVIRTSTLTDLNVNAPLDTINHYGFGKTLTITAIDDDCFYEYGTFGTASIASGKIIAKEGGFIGSLTTSGSGNAVEENGGYIGILGGTQNQSTYAINNLDDLLLFRDRVNTGCSFKGITVTLENNIDLSGIEWTPIGTFTTTIVGATSVELHNVCSFEGNFNGKNNTISNLTMNKMFAGDEKGSAGFFGAIAGEYIGVDEDAWTCTSMNMVTIENLKFTNVDIKADYKSGVLSSKISCVNVKNISVEGAMQGSQLGGIVGIAADSTFTDCTVDIDFSITVRQDYLTDKDAYYSFAGGICHQTSNNYDMTPKFNFDIKNCDVSACTFTKAESTPAIPSIDGAKAYKIFVGKYVGQAHYTSCYNLNIDYDLDGTIDADETGITTYHPDPMLDENY